MAWKAEQRAGETDGLLNFRIGGIEACLGDVLVEGSRRRPRPRLGR